MPAPPLRTPAWTGSCHDAPVDAVRVAGGRTDISLARAASAAAGRPLDDYWALHAWSILAEPDAFWRTCLRESGLPFTGSAPAAHDGAPMPDTRWFAGVTRHYAGALLAGRGRPADAAAIIALDEAAAIA